MPTIDPVKNLEYVKKSQAKKKEELGAKAFNRINADVEQIHNNKSKATMGEAEYKKATSGIYERIYKKTVTKKKK
jgi:hypothetical protein